ncbi:Intracellular distribution of mitochondria [Recurvomyces mirabilis]|nr:Intracellular distribution of mitochondria [Recurvomyces mirabilis]
MAETSTDSKPSTTNGTEDTTTTTTITNGHATSDALTNGTSDDASKEGGEAEDAAQPVDNVLKLRVDLPTHEHVDIIVSSQEQVQEIRQSIVDQPHTFQYSCFHLEYQGKRINDFVELAEVEGIVKDSEPVLKLVEDPYTEAQARMHVVRVRELIGAAGDRVDYVSGIDAGTSLCEDVELPVGDKGGKDDSSPVAQYDLNAPGPISALLPRQREPAPKTVKSISLSAWNPPPYHHRMRGHLLYLVVTTLEGDQHYITSHITGFYVNRSTNAKFDPEPRQMSKTSRAHSLITLLSEISDKFAGQFVRLQEYNGQRDPLASYALSNSIPAAPWLVSPTSMQQHQPDATRPQEPYLLAGADNAETLRDWNEEFQSTRELPKETVQDRVFRERLTSKLFAEYNEAAVRGAVLVGRGEVQPLNPTEARDAQIFVYNNVFYSFGADGVGTFASDGGDEAARVATGKDVQGVKAVNQLDITGLFTPGTVVVDYLGKRIVGQSIVPGIFKQRDPGEHQIDYGGVEGKDVIATHEGFANPFAELSKAMRVKKHAVWDKEAKRHELEASVETKGLLGTDGRKYVLDLYRVTPLDVAWLEEHRGTEQSEEVRYPHRMAVLRAELVDSWRIAKLREFISGELERKRGEREKEKDGDGAGKLTNGDGGEKEEMNGGVEEKKESNGEVGEEKKDANGETEEKKEASKQQETVDVSGFSFSLHPDVFSGQQPQTEEEKAEMEKDEADVRAVCAYLTDDVIPRLVRDIQEGEVGFPMDGQNLVRDMHKRGINARYLGVLAQKAKDLPAASEEQKDDKRLQLLMQLVQQEMVARAFKHVCIKYLRSLPACFAQNCIAHLLNCLLGAELNESPKADIDEAMKAMYNEAEFEFLDLTPEKLVTEIQRQVALRFRYEVGKEIVPAGKHLQMLREVCLKLGFQLEAKDYQFSKDGTPQQALQQKASAESLEVPQTNGVHPPTEGGNKKKKKKLQAEHSPNRAASVSPTTPPTTFQPENILNVVPIVKEASPRSMLAEEALDAGRMSIQQDQKELGQELLLESLSLHEQIYGILHPEVARVYYALSTLYYGLEEKNAAVELAKKAVIVSERTLGVDNAETILAYLNLSLMEHATGNTKNALALVRHALDLWKVVYGPHHPDSITTLNNAAVMLQTLKQFPESRKWFQSSLEICTDVAGKNSVNTATLLFQYAQALALDHDSRQAVERMRESYLVFRDLLGAENQNTREAGAWLDTLARSAVNQERAAKEASTLLNSSGQGRQRMLLRGAGGSTGRLGVSGAAATGKNGLNGSASGAEAQVQAHARATSSTGGLDKRSLDELVKYVNGSAEQQGRTTPKKKVVGNPKRRQQQRAE